MFIQVWQAIQTRLRKAQSIATSTSRVEHSGHLAGGSGGDEPRLLTLMNSSYSTHRWNQYGCFCAYVGTRVIFSLLVASLLLALPRAGASMELPTTPAGKVLAGYLEAVNSGNKEKLEAF